MTVNSSAANQSPPPTHEPPLSSTFANTADHQKGFWRNWSFAARKSYKVNPPNRRARATRQRERESCFVEMNPLNQIFEPRSTGTTGTTGNGPSTAHSTADSYPNLPTSLVNEHAQIGIESNLDEIKVVNDGDVHDNNS